MAEVPCAFVKYDWWPNNNSEFYTCKVTETRIVCREISKFIGEHEAEKSDDDVIAVRFDKCKMTDVPQGIMKIFKNLKILLIYGAEITKLAKEDFEEFTQITQLWFANSSIEYLPGNLFDHMPLLEMIEFSNCDISFIDPHIFNRLANLKVVKLKNNRHINVIYDSVSGIQDSISLIQLKRKLLITRVNPSVTYKTYYHIPYKMAADLKCLLNDESFKDVTIDVNGVKFMAHRFILAARSSYFAEKIKADPNVTTIKLHGVWQRTFEEILHYIYTGYLSFPGTKIDMVDLFHASILLGLDELKQHALNELEVTTTNAVYWLSIANKNGHKILQQKAFEKIKETLPDKVLKPEWAEDTSKIEAVLKAKGDMEWKIFKAKKKMENDVEAVKKKMEIELEEVTRKMNEKIQEAETEYDKKFM